MRLDPEWRRVARKAWSFRLLAVAALLTGCEAIVTVTGTDWIPLPPIWRALILFGLVAAALVARVIAQKDLPGG